MQLSKHIFHAPWLLLLYFLYIFNISFVPLPYFLRTRLIMGAFGIVLALFVTRPSDLSKSIAYLIGGLALLVLPSALTTAVNGVFDGWFIQYAGQQVFHLFGAYLLVVLSLRYFRGFSLDSLFRFVVYAVAVNNVLALVMFFSPALLELVMSVQNHDMLAASKLEEYIEMNFRFYGMGIHTFFMGGLISGFTLLLLAYLIRKERSGIRVSWLSGLFVLISITGLFIARTTLVGMGLGIAYILWPERWSLDLSASALGRNMRFVGMLLVVAVSGIALLNYVFPEAWDTDVIGHALELYISLNSGGEVATVSTDHLQTMYVWPDNFRTWLIGDGQFNTADGFYMDTDVGYLRMIYYFGIVGMVIFFLVQLYIALRIHQFFPDASMAMLLLTTLVYIFALNVKALADVNAFLYLILWLAILRDSSDAKPGPHARTADVSATTA